MLTTKQAAERLNCHVETVRRLVRAGKIPTVALSHTKRPQFRFDEAVIEDFIKNGGAIQ